MGFSRYSRFLPQFTNMKVITSLPSVCVCVCPVMYRWPGWLTRLMIDLLNGHCIHHAQWVEMLSHPSKSLSQRWHLPTPGSTNTKGQSSKIPISKAHLFIHRLFIIFIVVFQTQLLSYFPPLLPQLALFIRITSCLHPHLPLFFVFHLFHNPLSVF